MTMMTDRPLALSAGRPALPASGENFGLEEHDRRHWIITAGIHMVYRMGVLGLVGRMADRFVLSRPARGGFGFRKKSAPCFTILTYHRVHPTHSLFGIDTVTPALFESQMRCVRRQFTVLTVEEIVYRIRAGHPLPPRCAAITFDDGYADNYHHAYPILKRLGLRATFFLATGCIGSGQVLWFDRVLRAFEQTRCTEAVLPYAGEPMPLSTMEQRQVAGFLALRWLRATPGDEREAAMRQLFECLQVIPPAKDPVLMLDWDQVRAMARDGFRFGAHTVSHPILTTISLDEVATEVRDSKQAIEEATGQPVTTFAYPSGRPQDYSSEIVSLLSSAGYTAAVTSGAFAVNSTGEDLFRLKRMRPWERDIASFFLRLVWVKWFDSGQRSTPAEPVAMAPSRIESRASC